MGEVLANGTLALKKRFYTSECYMGSASLAGPFRCKGGTRGSLPSDGLCSGIFDLSLVWVSTSTNFVDLLLCIMRLQLKSDSTHSSLNFPKEAGLM